VNKYSPFHPGERHIQTIAGVEAASAIVGKSIARTIIPGAWSFLAAQQMIVIGSWDGQRGAWPCLVVGKPGFITTKDGAIVRLDLSAAYADAYDPIWANLQLNGKISLLAIELATRRRLRVNGRVTELPQTSVATSAFEVIVEQSYPNCPKYIQRRVMHVIEACAPTTAPPREKTQLSSSQIAIIAAADTCFVASVGPTNDTDVSHRGGNRGFVEVLSPTALRIPDYRGNNMFNTLGNIHATGFAGLLFVDFTTGRQLQIVGNAEIQNVEPSEFAQRFWTLNIAQVRESLLPVGVTWDFIDASPFNPSLLT
jgi:predicted pyridoxine 5'-phosphate oxidase superfamily flavin-nucleotide-binding protein